MKTTAAFFAFFSVFMLLCFSAYSQNILLSENFDGVTPPVLPDSWVAENASGTGTTWVTYGVFPHSPPNSVAVFGDGQPKDEWLFSPAVELEAGISYRLSFYYRTSFTPLQMQVKIGAGQSSEQMETQIFLNQNINNTVYTEGFAIITPESDKTVYFGWNVYDSGNQGNMLMDDILLEEMEALPNINLYPVAHNFGTISVNETAQTTFQITNLGGAQLQITGINIDPPFFADFSGTIPPGQSVWVDVDFLPQHAGIFTKELEILIDGDFEGNNIFNLFGIAYETVTEFFEDFEASDELPPGWSSIIQSTSGSANVSIYQAGQFFNHAYSGEHAARLYNGTTDDILMLITPELAYLRNGQISFWTKVAVFPEPLIIGTMSDSDNPDTFTEITTITATDEYQQFTFTFEDAPSDHTYVAFKHGTSANLRPVFIDDVEWTTEPDSLYPPRNLEIHGFPGGGGASLFWDAPEEGDPIGYNVYRDDQIINDILISELFFDDGWAESGVTYLYFVTAVYNEGESGPSNIVEYTPEFGYRLIYASSGENGQIIPEGVIELSYGDDQDFEIIADPGYEIDTLWVDDVPVEEASGLTEYTYSFINVVDFHEIHVEFAGITNLVNEEMLPGVKVYPNPARDYVNISFDNTFAGNERITFRIFDLNGKTMESGFLSDRDSVISLESLSPSVYLLEIRVDNRPLSVIRIEKL
ncbi:MAG: T9SS C-terminal target domain-containing protein [Bacteroidetes bacterium]|nr:MAG: T9SS C-terminal target domain-containing protein [Bacteroidota bacterium]